MPIERALVLLPPGTESSLHGNRIHPLARVGGLSILQRTLYNLQWAGIREGILLSYGAWPEVERAMREDVKNRAFSWITLPDLQPGGEQEARLDRLLRHPVLVQFPGWIVDRNLLRERLAETETGEERPDSRRLLAPASPAEAGTGSPPAAAIVGGRHLEALRRALLRKAPVEEVGRQLAAEPKPRVENVSPPALIRVERPEDRGPAEQQMLQGLIKPTESWLSRHLERKVSLALSRRLLHTRVTPNQISVFSLLLGLASALLFLPEWGLLHVVGALLLLLSSIVDGCDGELARLRYQESRLGSWLDFLGDNLVHMAVFFCIGFGLFRRGEGHVYLLLGSTAALCTAVAASSVFLRVILKAGSRVITFATPVRLEEMENAPGSLRKQIDFTDRISNRDFIYAILALTLVGQLWVFAWLSGLGSVFYLGSLLYLYWRMGIIGGGRFVRSPA